MKESVSIRRSRYAVLLGLVVLAGWLLLVVCTRWGVGISPDSTVYLSAARNLLDGHGLALTSADGSYPPLTQFPPFYSVVLAGIGASGLDLTQAAWWLNFLLMASSTLLIAFAILAYTRSHHLSLLASLLFVTSEISLEQHAQVLSEPLFVFLGLGGLCLLSAHLAGGRLLPLLAAAVVLGLAFLTRYVGGTLVVTGVLGILFLARGRRNRFPRALVFLIGAGGPGALWILRTLQTGGRAANRSWGLHPPMLSGSDAVQLLIPIVLLLGLWAWQRRMHSAAIPTPSPGAARLPSLLMLFSLVYLVLVLAAKTFLDASIPVSNRILVPVYVSILILGLCYLPGILPGILGSRDRRRALLTMGAVVLAVHVVNGSVLVLDLFHNGSGYSSPTWRNSRLVAYVQDLDSSVPIFTNGPDALAALTGQTGHGIPGKVDPMTGKPVPRFDRKIEGLSRRLAAAGGVLVYFRNLGRAQTTSEEELTGSIPLRVVFEVENEGAVYAPLHGP